MPQLRPFFEQVQAIYDVDNSTEFLSLFLDPTLLYTLPTSSASDMSLEEAQIAKLDLALGKIDLRPGHRLLEVGCGWAPARQAVTQYGVDVIGLTLSRVQRNWILDHLDDLPEASGQMDIRLQGWEEFNEPVDRIISIAAFEHFRQERHAAFFRRCRKLLPDDGRMLLHTIVWNSLATLDRLGVPVTHENVLFSKFIRGDISGRHALRAGADCPPQRGRRLSRRTSPLSPRALRPHAGHLGRQSRSSPRGSHRTGFGKGLQSLYALT